MKSASKRYMAIVIVLALTPGAGHAQAMPGIPVVDGTNLYQNVMTAMESVAQTLKQIQQYETQLQQYEVQLQNTIGPTAYIWDQAQATMNDLRAATDTLAGYKGQLGSIDAYLAKSKDLGHYQLSNCFAAQGCSDAEFAGMAESRRHGSEAQKRANDAMFRGLDRQQESLVTDARKLEQIQSRAQGATGQMQAIGYANQLASQQTNQLLQMRALLVAQQNATGAKLQADADTEAQQEASAQKLREGEFRASQPKSW